MPTPQDRINTMIALVNASPSIGPKSKKDIIIEFRQVIVVNSISPPPRKNILKVLHATRALDTTLRSFLDHHGILGRSHSIGQYLVQLTNHRLRTVVNISLSERTKYQNEIVNVRNKHLHTANSYPSNDREVYQLTGEMEALVTRII